MQTRQWIIVGIAILTAAGAAVIQSVLAGMKEPPELEKPPEFKKYVQTKPVVFERIKTNVEAYGRVQTAQSLDLHSEVSGRMYQGKIRLKEGTNFEKGTLLFFIDSKEAELNLKSQKSNFLKDLAAILPDIKIDFEESFDKWQKYFSEIDLNKDLPELPTVKVDKEKTFLATKGIYSSFYSIKSAEERLRKHFYYAPFDGSISEVNYESGAFVNPGVKIGKIIRAGVNELRVSVETKDIQWIQERSIASIHSDETGQSWEGEVIRISDFVNQNTQSVDVFIAIRNRGSRIYDGQFLKALIPAQIIENGMIIPRNVIYNGNEVFVLEDTLLKVHQIDILRVTENEAIFNGLDSGMDIVVEPLLNAHNNMKAFKADPREINLEGSASTIASQN